MGGGALVCTKSLVVWFVQNRWFVQSALFFLYKPETLTVPRFQPSLDKNTKIQGYFTSRLAGVKK